MPNCKLCNKPVVSGRVVHYSCWETEANKIAESICDEYCRFNRMGLSEVDMIEKYCNKCVLSHLVSEN